MTAYFAVKTSAGSLKIVKTSDDGKVEGIKFKVTGADNYSKTVTTNSKGEFQIDDLKVGTYTVTEITEERYEDQKAQTVKVESGKVATVEFSNVLKRGDLQVVKSSEDNYNSGVKFHLYGTSLSGAKVDEYASTDNSGVATFKNILVSGSTPYTLEEVDTAIRYVVPKSQTAPITWDKVTKREFTNTLKKFTVTVEKTDAEAKKAQGDATLAGAKYGIYDGDKLIDTYTTDKNGKFTTKEYICGDNWTIKEIEPSEGYLLNDTVLNDTVYPVTISEDGDLVEIEIVNEFIRGNVKTTKVDKDYPDNKLTGAVFEIYSDTNSDGKLDKEDELLGEIKETDTGIYEMDDLVYGHYLVKEKKAPDGFILDENTYPVFIETDGKTYEVENDAGKGFQNVAMKGSLKIVKTSSDKKVEGFSFRVTGENGYDKTFKTDKNGEILIEGLRIGKYVVSEVNNEASAGYMLPDDEVIEIEYGKTATVKMHNEKINIPQTGDGSAPSALWLMIGGVSAVGIAACVTSLLRKRKKNNKEAA